MVLDHKHDLYSAGLRRGGHNRPQRVADMIRNEIATLLITQIKDPRLLHVSIVSVRITKDLKRAMVFYSVLGDEQAVKAAGEGLAKAKGFIRRHISREMDLRVTPELEFKHDLSIVRQEEMERLLRDIRREDGLLE